MAKKTGIRSEKNASKTAQLHTVKPSVTTKPRVCPCLCGWWWFTPRRPFRDGPTASFSPSAMSHKQGRSWSNSKGDNRWRDDMPVQGKQPVSAPNRSSPSPIVHLASAASLQMWLRNPVEKCRGSRDECRVEICVSLWNNLRWINREGEDYARIHLCLVAVDALPPASVFPIIVQPTGPDWMAINGSRNSCKCFELRT